MRHKRAFIVLGAAALLLIALPAVTAFGGSAGPSRPAARVLAASSPLGTGFTYQGRLTDNGQPANGPYDMQFTLYDAASGGDKVGDTQDVQNVLVTAGIFTVTLDFGDDPDIFNGDARWLEIAIRPDSPSGDYTTLTPKQPVTPTPYALFAKTAGALVLPYSAEADTEGNAAIFEVIQTGDGTAIAASRETAGSAPTILSVSNGGSAVKGESAGGGGTGVEGTATGNGTGVSGSSATGVGVAGSSTGTGSAAGSFLGDGADTDALRIGNGAIKVTGNIRPAFALLVSEDNICDAGEGSDNGVVIDNDLANGDSGAIILVTPRNSDGTAPAVTVTYNACGNAKWVIVPSIGPAANDEFNVLIIKDDNTS